MRLFIYQIMVFMFALLCLPAPDYVDNYGRHYRISRKGTWTRAGKKAVGI